MPRTRSTLVERRKSVVPAAIPRTRFRRGGLIADILQERRAPGVTFAIVQRRASPEVLFLGQFYSVAEAEAAAKEFIATRLHRSAA